MLVQGNIENIKPIVTGNGARGEWKKRSFQLNGEWYGGFLNKDNAPVVESLSIGDSVKFEMTTSPDGKFKNFKDIELVATSPSVSNSAAPAAGVAAAPAADNYQMRMNFIGAQTRALKFVELLMNAEDKDGKKAVKLKGKAEDMQAELDKLVAHYTDKFALEAWNATEPVDDGVDSEFEE